MVDRTLHYNKNMTGSVPNHCEADIKKGHMFKYVLDKGNQRIYFSELVGR